ncbi:hypothetical protein K6025_03770 [Ehrlichia sp. JZT12]
MKIPFVVSALTSLLVLYSHSAFSSQAQGSLFLYDKNHELENSVKSEKEDMASEISVDNIVKAPVYSSFNNIERKGVRLKFSGDAMFYIWNSANNVKENSDIIFYCSLNKNCTLRNFNQDNIIGIGIESSHDKYGNTYAVDLISHINGKSFTNEESKVTVKTPYGDLSFGYQKGVESVMRFDASNIAVGGTRSNWIQHLRGVPPSLIGRRSGSYYIYNFIFNPGLYTEGIIRNYCDVISNTLSICSINLYNGESLVDSMKIISDLEMNINQFSGFVDSQIKDMRSFNYNIQSNLEFILKNLRDAFVSLRNVITPSYIKLLPEVPFRLSYKSQDFMGLKFGISYVPFSYDGYLLVLDMLNKSVIGFSYNKDDLEIKSDSRVKFKDGVDIYFINPIYQRIISGGISYAYDMNDIKFSASVVGEYGKNMSYDELYSRSNSKKYNGDTYNDLQGIAIGLGIDYNKVKVVGAYGYLGKSGIYIPRCDMSPNKEKCEIYNASYIFGKRGDQYGPYINSDRVSYDNYYWDIGVAYQFKSLDLSITYFQSNRIGHILKDINLGFEYNLLKYNGFEGSLFGNLHHYIFDQVKNTYEPGNLDVKGKGNVLMLGMKLKF